MDKYILFGKWYNSNRLYNPLTKRKIKKDKKTYKKILKLINLYIQNNNSTFYIKNRINNICPLSLEQIERGYKVDTIWNPFTGIFTNLLDPFGPISFDTDYLIYFFYTNRLRHIYVHGSYNTSGHLGDAIGQYPNFKIPGRGSHPEWYLFRLPLTDCYTEKNNLKYVTMGPELTRNDIIEIYNISLHNKTYEKKFNKKIPNIVKLFDIYYTVVNKCPYHIEPEVLQTLGNDYIMQMKTEFFLPLINKIIHFN
jgi:hypothetical protein